MEKNVNIVPLFLTAIWRKKDVHSVLVYGVNEVRFQQKLIFSI